MVPSAGICCDCAATHAAPVPCDTCPRHNIHPELRGAPRRLYLHPAHPQSAAGAAWAGWAGAGGAWDRLRHAGAAAHIWAAAGDLAYGAAALGRANRDLSGWITNDDRPVVHAHAARTGCRSDAAADLGRGMRRSD